MTFASLPLAALLLVGPSAPNAGSFDWPQWRGPNQDAISKETGLLKQWGPGGPPKAWTAEKLGAGHSTPSIAAGKIFGMGTRDGQDGMWALNEADGKELWFTLLDKTKDVNQNNGPGGSPTYADGKVYGITNTGVLACLDAANGKVVWSTSFAKDFGAELPTNGKWWGYNGSVLVDDSHVICLPGSATAAVTALDAATGKVIWKTSIPKWGNGFGYSTPVKATIAGVPMYVALISGDPEHTLGGVVGVDPKTGKLLWQYTRVGTEVAAIPCPIVRGDLVWCSCSYGDGGSALLKIIPDDKGGFAAKELKYYAKKAAGVNNHHGGMILLKDHVYFGHDQNQGAPVCVEFATGEIKWGPEKAPAGGLGSSAYLFADGLFYVRFQNHVMTLLDLNPEGMKVVSSFKPAEFTKQAAWAHPVIANGKLYLRDQDKLMCFNVKASSN